MGVFWAPCPLSLQRRLRSPSVLEPRILLTPCADACRCSRRSLWRSTSTRAPWTASRRSLPKRAWQRACTRGSSRTWSVALAVPWCLSCTIARRCTSVSEAWTFEVLLSSAFDKLLHVHGIGQLFALAL